MKNLVSHLHSKPKAYRTRVVFSLAATITSFIFVVWMSTLPGRLAEQSAALSADNRTSNVAAVPFSADQFTDQFDTIQGTLNLLRSGEPVNPETLYPPQNSAQEAPEDSTALPEESF